MTLVSGQRQRPTSSGVSARADPPRPGACGHAGLDLILDESESHAFPKSLEDRASTFPRLIPCRKLTFDVGLLLALLRGGMLEVDTNSSELRLIMPKQEIADPASAFLPESSHEVTHPGPAQRQSLDASRLDS